jgi:hypothetical protein
MDASDETVKTLEWMLLLENKKNKVSMMVKYSEPEYVKWFA